MCIHVFIFGTIRNISLFERSLKYLALFPFENSSLMYQTFFIYPRHSTSTLLIFGSTGTPIIPLSGSFEGQILVFIVLQEDTKTPAQFQNIFNLVQIFFSSPKRYVFCSIPKAFLNF